MLKKALIALAVLIVVLVIAIVRQPDTFQVTRSATIAAPVEIVFTQVNDLHKWEAWSPWAKLDPQMQVTFEGPASGVGAVSAWAGNHEVGEGKMTIIESNPNQLIRFQLDFLKPFKATSTSEFVFAPKDNQTEVTWSMSGTNNFISKAMSLVMDCDKMIGGQFEQGLAQMKAVAEAEAVQ